MRTIIQVMMAILMIVMPLAANAKSRPVDLMSRVDSQHCIASAVYYEAMGENRQGKIAVAYVIINRMKSGKFASTPCGVVYQKGQFSWINPRYRTLVYSPEMWAESMEIAQLVLSGKVADASNGAMYFHNRRVHPAYGRNHKVVAILGQHVFRK